VANQPTTLGEICMNYITTEHKYLSLKEDEFAEILGAIVSIVIAGYGRTIAGKLIELSDQFVTLEHRDGRRTKIRRRDISLISPIPTKETITRKLLIVGHTIAIG
jgi:hypothetical protein